MDNENEKATGFINGTQQHNTRAHDAGIGKDVLMGMTWIKKVDEK